MSEILSAEALEDKNGSGGGLVMQDKISGGDVKLSGAGKD